MASSAETAVTRSWEQYLRQSAVPRAVIDAFIQRPHWATFDPELGYVLHNSLVQAGIDGSRTIETFLPSGARSRFVYADRKPRINTYGDSFTEGNQVSDGETWQEYLGGHFGEPIGNCGVGNYGVYNPRGNHLFAYALKDTLLELLDPKPLPCRDQGPDSVDDFRVM